jgi:prepilin-type N-terminal cleavage/methylation domain-containing protein
MRARHQQGFTIVELLVAIGITLIVMTATMMIYHRSVQISGIVTNRAEIQSELRAAADQIARDLNQAGTGIPIGGLPIPSATTGGTNPQFGCDASQCYLTTGNKFTNGVLYKVTPANSIGPTTTEPTDAIVIAYLEPIAVDPNDPNASGTAPNWSGYTTDTIADDGSTLTMPADTTPKISDPAFGLVLGDILMVQNSSGSALGVVTNFDDASHVITFAANDPLNLNQPIAPIGNIAALKLNPVPGSGPKYPSSTVSRVMMITYFIQPVVNSQGTDYRLMRQVDARTPSPVAEHIEDLQFTYDVFDDSSNAITVNLADAATGSPPTPKPNQIRKINMTITARSSRPNAQGNYDRQTLTTSIGPRNLSFHDRYN